MATQWMLPVNPILHLRRRRGSKIVTMQITGMDTRDTYIMLSCELHKQCDYFNFEGRQVETELLK